MHVHVLDVVERLVAIHGRVDDGVVDEGHLFLDLLVPAARVLGEGLVVVGVGAERGEERGLVVGAAADPSVTDACPFRDGVARADEILGRARRLVEAVGESAAPRVGGGRQHVLPLRIVEGVVQAREHPGGVAERRVRRDVFHALAIDPDLAAVANALEVFIASHRTNARRGVHLIVRRSGVDGHDTLPCVFVWRRHSTPAPVRAYAGLPTGSRQPTADC